MTESTHCNSRYRSRAQSLFEARSRTNTAFTLALLDRLLSYQNSPNVSIETETNGQLEESDIIIRTGIRRKLFFIFEPIVSAFLIFPLLILFWQAGWNFMAEWLKTPFANHWTILTVLYLLSQFIFLFIYLNQDRLYKYLHRKNSKFYVSFLLQIHTLITASNYIIQWVSMWTIWDLYTSDNWLLMLVVSIAAVLAIMVLMGHPCDLVCAPFIISYDSIEYNIRIGIPFRTDNMNAYVAHFVNYIFYEYILSLLSILAWRGSYKLLDDFLYPEKPVISAGLSILIGYPLYFILMYTQSLSNRIFQLPTFIYLNYPSFIQNIRHLTAFFTCVLLWRGFWALFDTYIATMSLALKYIYQFYIVCMLISFSILSLMKTASSINGPMSYMFDQYDLFPHYPNCYLVKWFTKNYHIDSDENSSNLTKSNNIEPCANSLI